MLQRRSYSHVCLHNVLFVWNYQHWQMKETLAAKQNNDIPHAFFDQTFTFYEIDKLQEEAAVGWYRRLWFQPSWIEIGQNRSSPRTKELFIERNQSLKSPNRKVCWVVAGYWYPKHLPNSTPPILLCVTALTPHFDTGAVLAPWPCRQRVMEILARVTGVSWHFPFCSISLL